MKGAQQLLDRRAGKTLQRQVEAEDSKEELLPAELDMTTTEEHKKKQAKS